jgi:hypothetical protein
MRGTVNAAVARAPSVWVKVPSPRAKASASEKVKSPAEAGA